MDFYSSSFTLPRVAHTATLPAPLSESSNSGSPPPASDALPVSTPLVSRIPSCLPPPVSHPAQPSPTHLAPSLPSQAAVSRTCQDLMARHACLVSSARHPNGPYVFRISGSQAAVLAARAHLVRENPFEAERVVRMNRTDVLEGGSTVKPAMKRKLDEIAALSRAHLSIVGSEAGIGEVDVVIRGQLDAVEHARINLLVLFDQLTGLHSDVCEIDYKLHYIVSGRKREVIQSIQEETCTNIYFPSCVPNHYNHQHQQQMSGLGNHRNTGNGNSKQNMIFITGDYFGVQRAREMLFQVSLHKSKCIISRDTALLPRKLDWLLMEKLEPIKHIMHINGTFINFPPIGSQITIISVYGDNVVPIERTIRSLMQLACEFYMANIWLLSPNTSNNYLNESSELLNQTEMVQLLDNIALETGAEVVFKASNSFDIYGTRFETALAVKSLLELEGVRRYQPEIRFQVELACEHRDFISGKKNGKLNKIMKTSDVKIKFESFNDYNFLIDLSGTSTSSLIGLNLLEEELPAEISFHIPEMYHKKIIGVGGKNIQRIMKKFGVYVKFSNAEEFNGLGGYVDNYDNVIARTPAKNASNLENLKQSVMELVHPKDKNYTTLSIPVPRHTHRTLLGEKTIFLHDISTKTGTRFFFPSSETGLEKIDIFGPEAQIRSAIQMMMIHVGLEVETRIEVSDDLLSAIGSEEFQSEVVDASLGLWAIRVEVRRESESVVVRFLTVLGRNGGVGLVSGDGLRNSRARFDQFLADRKIDVRGTQQQQTISNSPVGTKFRGRSRTASSSFSSFLPTTPTDPFNSFTHAPSHSQSGDFSSLHKPSFDHHHHLLHHHYPTSTAYPASNMGHGNRLYSNSFGSSASGGQGLGAVGPATVVSSNQTVDWQHNTVPRQMMETAETARFQQEQISEQIRRLSARAQSLDLGRGGAAVGGVGVMMGHHHHQQGAGGNGTHNAPGGSGTRHRISQSSSLFGGLGIGL